MSTLKLRYEFINFQERHDVVSRTTKIYACCNNRSGAELGDVRWYGAWRQYCYFPTAQAAVYSAGCLRDIDQFIAALMAERKAAPV